MDVQYKTTGYLIIKMISGAVRLDARAQHIAAARAAAICAIPSFDSSFVKCFAVAQSVESACALSEWSVPKLSATADASSCGKEYESFNLLSSVFGVPMPLTAVSAASAPVRRLAPLRAIVGQLQELTGAEWLGVYRVIDSPPSARPGGASERCLVKEAYCGAPSRPFFPLTARFAEASNNSAVGLSGVACILSDTSALAGDDPYYVCDSRVQSELCAPICDPSGAVIGILDAEAFKPHYFSRTDESPAGEARADALLLACQQLGAARLFVDLLCDDA